MKKGFSLIELLVVITILAILAGAALPYVQNYVNESRISKAKADLEEISRALAVYETREGEYEKSDITDLVGRYLNKSPIDPWGETYVVAPASGTVFSKGPDRIVGTGDDIVVAYQPPIALVSAKWVDRNYTARVDTVNVRDQLILTFSRKLQKSTTDYNEDSELNVSFIISTDGLDSSSQDLGAANILDANSVLIQASRSIIYEISTNDAFKPGMAWIVVKPNNDILDMAGNKAISGQKVVILPQ